MIEYQQVLTILKDVWVTLSTPLFEISGSKLSVMTFITAIFLFIIFVKVAGLIEKVLRRFLSDKPLDSGVKDSLAHFGRYLTIVIGAIITLETIGVSL